MILSKTMESAIVEKDLGKIYSSFYTILLSDPGFSTGKFDQTFNEVKSRSIEGFLQPYNGKPFKTKEEWNPQYWDSVASELMDNFCVERIDHLKEVGDAVYPSPNKQIRTEVVDNNQNETQKKTEQIQLSVYQQKNNTGKILAIAAIIVIILIIVIVLIL